MGDVSREDDDTQASSRESPYSVGTTFAGFRSVYVNPTVKSCRHTEVMRVNEHNYEEQGTDTAKLLGERCFEDGRFSNLTTSLNLPSLSAGVEQPVHPTGYELDELTPEFLSRTC